MKLKLFSTFFLIISLIGCNNQGKPKDFDYGHIESSKYVNSFFDMEMTIPAGWNIQNKEEMEDLAKAGKDLVAGNDAKMEAVIKASEINTANLLTVFQFESDSAYEYNPSFTLVAENVKNFPQVKTGGDYLAQTRKMIEQSQLKYDRIDKEFSKEIINGTEFYKMNAEINYAGLEIKQTYYSTILKGFSFNAIISYVGDEQEADLLKSIGTLKFNN